MDKSRTYRRRKLLQALGVGSTLSLAGCNTEQDSSPEASTTVPSAADTERPTTSDDQPPTVEQFATEFGEAGTVLDVSMTVRDNRALAAAEVGIGTHTKSTKLEGSEASIEERLTEVSDSSTPEASRVQYRVRDAAGNETSGEVSPDGTAPSLSIDTYTPDSAGAVQISVDGEDNVGLAELRIWVNVGDVLREPITGETTLSKEVTVSTESVSASNNGERNRVTVALTDTVGNSTRKDVTQYVRNYDKMENPRLNLGGLYISQAGNALEYNLSDEVDTEPAVGMYNSPIPPEITSRHIDQMTGFGFTHVAYDYGDQRPWAEAFLKSDLANQVDIMPTYIMPIFGRNMDKSWKDEVLPRTLTFLKEEFLSRDNAVTIDGRPVLDTWNWRVLAAHDDKRKKLLDEFGSFEAFADFVRQEAKTDRGEPHVMFGIGSAAPHLYNEGMAPLRELTKQFDGLRTWFHGTRGGWDDVIDRARADFEACMAFAEKHDMEFTPIARPGYDERWDTGEYRKTDRYLPRDPQRFKQLLELADEYRTTDRVFVCYNDWIEGHTIEPGTFTGTEYGTEYLEVVKEFQQPKR